MTVTTDLIRELALLEPGSPVLSVHLQTDPRDPANTAKTPRWLVALRNGLRDASRTVEESVSRDERLALTGLLERAETELLSLDASERGRGIAWFVTADGSLNQRLTLQLPPREETVRLDTRPFISPLVDVADRGRPTGLILISAEAMRLVHWEGGLAEEPERSLYEFELGEWRDYSTYAMTNPGSPNIHIDTAERRIEEWRRRFLREAAATLAGRLDELGWDRFFVVGERRAADGLVAALPTSARDLIAAQINANILWEEPSAVAERLEADLEAVWVREARALASSAVEAAQAGGPAAIGWLDVLDGLIQRRVRHLVLASGRAPDPETLPAHTLEMLGWPSRDFLVERAIEHAVGGDAGVTALPEEASGMLADVGAAATLRYSSGTAPSSMK